jgi:predicted alpha/beta superfamily hydrolase
VRDYTPAVLPTEAESGCAAAFLRFLTGTFWPDLARRVPVREDVRGVAGHSLSSLFVLHALWQEKPFFHRHLASAPSLWWVDRAILCDAQNLQRKGVALPAKLFPSLGEEDRESMTGDLTLLEDQLAELSFPELEVSTRRFPGRNHFNVLPAAWAVGLRALFTAEPPIPSLSFK